MGEKRNELIFLMEIGFGIQDTIDFVETKKKRR